MSNKTLVDVKIKGENIFVNQCESVNSKSDNALERVIKAQRACQELLSMTLLTSRLDESLYQERKLMMFNQINEVEWLIKYVSYYITVHWSYFLLLMHAQIFPFFTIHEFGYLCVNWLFIYLLIQMNILIFCSLSH